jgi:hypothetical protein
LRFDFARRAGVACPELVEGLNANGKMVKLHHDPTAVSLAASRDPH